MRSNYNQYSAHGLADSTTYYWYVTGNNIAGRGANSQIFSFTTSIPVPQPPLCISPDDGVTDQPIWVSLIWNKVKYGSSYHIQVSTNNSFSNLFLYDSTLTDSLKALNGLIKNGTYYWRVRAKNNTGPGNWSAVSSFTVTNMSPPLTPQPLLPTDNAVDRPLPVTFS
ncbi:MAG TPA: hypothetical protein VHP36_00165 [Chitinispirillaceae bacterium]|nr:hypothetical protein [Chitinispirillaceae bacterium]